jgi:hypothetical protein
VATASAKINKKNIDNTNREKNKQRMPTTETMYPIFNNGISQSITANYMGKRVGTTHVYLHILPRTTIE